MATSGLVVTFQGEPEPVRSALARDPRLTVGPANNQHMAVVLMTDSTRADRAAVDDMRLVPSVVDVVPVFVHLEPATTPEES
jgi:hypothetical protein